MEELTVPELNVSSPVLKASAHHFGKYCDNESKEFMLCMSEEKDPAKCLKEGAAVTSCGFKFFNLIRGNCLQEFTEYWKCVDHSGSTLDLENCRAKQKPFDKCVLDKLCWVRPERGYFAKIRLHDTDRPKPAEVNPELPEWTPGPRRELDKDSDSKDNGRFTRGDRDGVKLY